MRYGLFFLLMLMLAVTSASAQTVYYIGPDGNDSNSGLSENEALKRFEDAAQKLGPGDSLIVLDGVYEPSGENNWVLRLRDVFGTEENPIVVKAQNERQAWLKSDGQYPALDILESRWIIVEGLRASSANLPDEQERNGSPVRVGESENITLRRLLVHDNNMAEGVNVTGVKASHSQHVLIEESELYDFKGNGFVAFQSEDVTIRRCYANSRGDQGDSAFKAYYSSHFLVENSISEGGTHGFSSSSGRYTVTGDTSGQHLRYFGNISLDDERSGAMDSRDRTGQNPDGSRQVIRDVLYRNHLAVGSTHRAYLTRAVGDLTMENVTVVDAADVFLTNLDPQKSIGAGRYQWFSCETAGGCQYRLRNWLVAYNQGPVLDEDLPPNDDDLDFLAEHSNFYQSGGIGASGEDISDSEGQVQHSMQEEPTSIGPFGSDCLVFVPDTSNMAGAGADTDDDGAPNDIGANILYRYHDGELTDTPLWDPQTGEFPHGAIIDSVNGVPRKSLFDVHERLNVNTNGCPLPESYAAGSTAREATNEQPGATRQLQLQQNAPNPFGGASSRATEITFALPQARTVTLAVYDVLGREVARLVEGQQMAAGEHSVRFEAGNLPSGTYVYRLKAGALSRAKRMMLMR